MIMVMVTLMATLMATLTATLTAIPMIIRGMLLASLPKILSIANLIIGIPKVELDLRG